MRENADEKDLEHYSLIMKFKPLLYGIVAFVTMAVHSLAATVNVNVAKDGTAYANGALYGGGLPRQLIDGAKSPQVHGDTALATGFAYTIDLGKSNVVSELKIYPRQDGCCPERLANFRVSLHSNDGGAMGAEVWGTNLFTTTGNAGSGAGVLLTVPVPAGQSGQWIEIRSLADPVPNYALQINEVEVYAPVDASEVNRALGSIATVNQATFGGAPASILVDGVRVNSVHATATPAPGFAYDINLAVEVTMNKIIVFPRQDGCCPDRLTNYRVSVYTDNAGQPGTKVWSADMHTDGSFPPTDFGTKEIFTPDLDPAGTFKGQWVRIESLDAAPAPYAMQLAEVEVYGTIPAAVTILVTSEPADIGVAVGGSGTLSIGLNAINADPALIGYQWSKNGTDIPGATNATYTTPTILSADSGSKFRVRVTYPGHSTITSREATLKVNYAFGAVASVNGPLWPPGGFNIQQLVDGNRRNFLHGDATLPDGYAYSMRLGGAVNFEAIDIYPRDNCCPDRVSNIRVSVHSDNAGEIGAEVWSADLFTNPGENAGASVVHVVGSMDPDGTFAGRWIKITALASPVPSYALQISEVEAFGSLQDPTPKLTILSQTTNTFGAPGRVAKMSVTGNIFNGIRTNITYQWRKGGVIIAGATNATYTTPILAPSDDGSKYTVTLSYAGAVDVTSSEITLSFDYNYARYGTAYLNQKLWVGVPDWSIQQIIDGNRANIVHGDTDNTPGVAYTINMGSEVTLTNIDIYPRQDTCCPERLGYIRVSVHKDNGGQIGDQVWFVDLFPEGNAGSGPGTVVNITPEMDPAGTFKGQWIKIMSLADPVPAYSLQIGEVEAIGSIVQRPFLTFTTAGGLTLNWTEGILESSTDFTTWGAVNGANSPYLVPRTDPARFFRAKK